MPISKNKRTTQKRLKQKRKKQVHAKRNSAKLSSSYRSIYIGIGISIVVIGFFLMYFGDGSEGEFGLSILLIFIGSFLTVFGKLASKKDIVKSKQVLSDVDSDLF